MAKRGAIEKSPDGGGASAIVEEIKDHGKILGGTIGLLWAIQIVNTLLGGALAVFGVIPRSLVGLRGVLFMPFIHGGFAHLIANTIPLAVLGWFTMMRRKRDFFYVSAISALVSGLGTWLIGPAGVPTVGASGVIFGLLGYLLSRGIFEKKLWPIVGSVVTLFLYGGALFGIVPGAPGISWQAHLFGLIGGILAARVLSLSPEKSDEKAPAPKRTRVAAPAGDEPRLAASKKLDADDPDVEAELEALRRRA